MKFAVLIGAFAREEDGVTAIEYAFVALLVALAIVGALVEAGLTLSDIFSGFDGYIRTS